MSADNRERELVVHHSKVPDAMESDRGRPEYQPSCNKFSSASKTSRLTVKSTTREEREGRRAGRFFTRAKQASIGVMWHVIPEPAWRDSVKVKVKVKAHRYARLPLHTLCGAPPQHYSLNTRIE